MVGAGPMVVVVIVIHYWQNLPVLDLFSVQGLGEFILSQFSGIARVGTFSQRHRSSRSIILNIIYTL